jgi:hypothetical protein
LSINRGEHERSEHDQRDADRSHVDPLMRPSICISGLSRAERKAGQLLQVMEKLKGRPAKASGATTLSDLGSSVINR